MKMSRFFTNFIGLVFCIILIVSGIDVARFSAMTIVVYADQVSDVEEAAESDENSDANEAEEDSEDTDDADSDNGDDDKEKEDVNTDSNTEDSDTDVAEENSDVAETQPETIPETETVAETEAVKEVPAKSHSTRGGGITTYDNSEMDYINNPETPVVIVEEVIPEPKAIEVPQPVVTVTGHHSTPKTGESDDLYLLTACILILFALILNTPSFYGKTGATLSTEVKSINRDDSIKALGVTATRANCRTRRSRRMQKRALAFLAFGQTR
ncbi:hypothetical protein SAMN05216349_1693 [Oribacterium sp. KHPX15]|uniref:hypothetical protein n=1 Tax=Oribacterium sp. KHPX15 TaxID=1855342 RepID=UPI00089CC69E|nr:hypothetical protein [Oribacterium sp. KHPX15]SEA96279.1 hypothetical protein SAMN05216349_1693 [Oribacterium sp. KHPX15]